jgi:hypothetical protein
MKSRTTPYCIFSFDCLHLPILPMPARHQKPTMTMFEDEFAVLKQWIEVNICKKTEQEP